MPARVPAAGGRAVEAGDPGLAGWLTVCAPDAVLSSVCAALAASRGIGVGPSGRSVRRHALEDSRLADAAAIEKPDRLRWSDQLVSRSLVRDAARPSCWRSSSARPIASNSALPGLLEPSDSLRNGRRPDRAAICPKTSRICASFARPPVTFYLGRIAPVSRSIGSRASSDCWSRDAATWALLDTAMDPAGGGSRRRADPIVRPIGSWSARFPTS